MNKRRFKKDGMVDIGTKDVTQRVASAESIITFSLKAFQAFLKNGSPKGDVLETAKIAGIMAAKATPSIVPMCHPVPLNKVTVTFTIDEKSRKITARSEVSCMGRTGVEIEALVAVSVATLTIYDMMKWADKGAVISQTRLLHKTGGKSGDFHAK